MKMKCPCLRLCKLMTHSELLNYMKKHIKDSIMQEKLEDKKLLVYTKAVQNKVQVNKYFSMWPMKELGLEDELGLDLFNSHKY